MTLTPGRRGRRGSLFARGAPAHLLTACILLMIPGSSGISPVVATRRAWDQIS